MTKLRDGSVQTGPHRFATLVMPKISIFSLIALMAVSWCSAFDSSEIRLLEDQNEKRHSPISYISYFDAIPTAELMAKRTHMQQQQYASGAPLIRFGKRAGLRSTRSGGQLEPLNPLIRFGKRSPSPQMKSGAPLIRFGKRTIAQQQQFQGPSAPLIRFGKRFLPSGWFGPSRSGKGEEVEPAAVGSNMGYYEPIYERYQRNPRPNPVEEEDTMLRFG